MTDIGWGNGSPAESDTNIVQALLSFVTQGGQLFAARRWADNPLTLTHVRWQGETGAVIDAVRLPQNDDTLGPVERNVWVQLALAFPTSHPSPAGPDAPWLPLPIDQQRAAGWLNDLQQASLQRPSSAFSSSYISGAPTPLGPHYNPPSAPYQRGAPPPYTSGSTGQPTPHQLRQGGPPPAFNGGTSYPQQGGNTSAAPAPGFASPWHERIPTFDSQQPQPSAGSQYSLQNAEQFSGSWQRNALQTPEIAALPCIEIELPGAMLQGMNSASATDYQREFARNVAMSFSRATRTIPQVHELRGWMRGNRLVLAARFVVGMGTRPPSRIELDGAAQLLASALAREPLPFTRMSFAEPGEWLQGAALPE